MLADVWGRRLTGPDRWLDEREHLLREDESALRGGDMHAAIDVKAARCEEWFKNPPGVAFKAALISQFRRPDCQALQDLICQH
jgi:hypothetical protein